MQMSARMSRQGFLRRKMAAPPSEQAFYGISIGFGVFGRNFSGFKISGQASKW
jgi:hypothetical protein